jgi:hypothetical protein
VKKIRLTQGKVALVDDADFAWLNQWKWCAWTPDGKNFYAKRGTDRDQFLMHIAIFGAKGVDHRDRNGLNNQRCNLRPATKSQNGANRGPNKNNSSGFKGVHWFSPMQKWRARIMVGRKEKHLGYFKDPVLAALVYDLAAIHYFGQYSKTNQSLGLVAL